MSAANAPTADLAAKPAAASVAPRPRVVMPLLVVGAYWVGWLVMTLGFPGTFAQFQFLFFSPMILSIVLLIWFLAFSRLAWIDRLGTILAVAAGGGLATLACDRSMPFGLLMYALPVALTAVSLWLVVQKGAPTLVMRIGLIAISLASWGYYTLIRIDGIAGNMAATRNWRWTETPEQRRLAELAGTAAAKSRAVLPAPSAADWTDFRGPSRDGVVHGTHFDADWAAHPPRELWRRRIGPGWSSFVTIGDIGFTQEQRGEKEAVICIDLKTGNAIWDHVDEARFWEVVAGAGPRATPTLSDGKLFVQGASGLLNCLDAATGTRLWSRDILKDSHEQAKTKPDELKSALPSWGYSSSPLVTGGIVVAFAGGKEGQSVLAYNAESGERRWHGGQGLHSYSSPQLVSLDGIDQVLMSSDFGLESFDPQTGKILWEHKWTIPDIFRVCQPRVLSGGRILLGTPMSGGTRLLSVTRDGASWNVAEQWLADDFKPYFNDFVSHQGFLYGFDGEIFTCRDLTTGKRQWKKGRYGHGQVLLAADQGLLIVISEKGELVLLEADSKNLIERGRLKAIDGKTWNHPVITGNKLLVRNAEEMACFELANAKAGPAE